MIKEIILAYCSVVITLLRLPVLPYEEWNEEGWMAFFVINLLLGAACIIAVGVYCELSGMVN